MKYYGYTHLDTTYWLGPISYKEVRYYYDIFSYQVQDNIEGILELDGNHEVIWYDVANRLMDLHYWGE
jgi:hypothetical protein